MTERNGETAHKNVRRNYRRYKKKLRKKIATLLIKKGNVKKLHSHRRFRQDFEV